MAMPLHFFFYRTIGPAVYGGGAATVVDTNWAEEFAYILNPGEESMWVFDFTQEAVFNDNAAAPAKDKSQKKAKGGPWTNDANDFLGWGIGLYRWARQIHQYGNPLNLGPNGKFITGPDNAVITQSPTLGAGVSSSTDSEVAPDGATPELITVTSTSNAIIYNAVNTSVGFNDFVPWTIDWYVKNIDADYVQMFYSPNFYVNFDISTGVKGTCSSGVSSGDYSITAISDGYYRLRWVLNVSTFNYASGPTFSTQVYLGFVESASAAYGGSLSATGQQLYYWRSQLRAGHCADEYIRPWAEISSYSVCITTPVHTGSGDVIGLGQPVSDTSIHGVYTGSSLSKLAGGGFDMENDTGFTESNITATFGENAPILDWQGNDVPIANLLTVSSAGGSGVATVSYPSTTQFSYNPNYEYFLVKAGTADCIYMSVTGTHVQDGSTVYTRYYDLTNGEITSTIDYESQGPIDSQETIYNEYYNQHLRHNDGSLLRISDDWWIGLFTYRGNILSATTRTLKVGICDAPGSTSCTLNGQYLTFMPVLFGSGGGNASCNAATLIPSFLPFSQTNYSASYNSRIYLDSDLELDRTTFSMYAEHQNDGAMYVEKLIYSDASGTYPYFTWYTYKLYSISSSTLVRDDSYGIDNGNNISAGCPTGRPTRWAMSSQANDFIHTIDGYETRSADTSGSVPANDWTYIQFESGLLRRFGHFNRACTESELEQLTSAKIPSDLDTLKVRSPVVDVLCSGWPSTDLECGLLQVQVLRSTAGT